MTLHKLTAGSGYDYLTRQVAALDATDKGHTGLATYYSQRGESPGCWVGSGMAGIDGLAVEDAVTADQMRNLFGAGLHPLMEQQIDALTPQSTAAERAEAGLLGKPFPIYKRDVTPFRIEVARRVSAVAAHGDSIDARDVRARIRTEVATEMYAAQHGAAPTTEHELAGFIAQQSRPKTTTVAGYDLTFSPVKSVSTLWALADVEVAATIERCHRAAAADALAFIEQHALYTRTGAQGIRQVDVTGLVATAFTHRDNRNGDPDLHTHVAVANKVQTHDGKWLSIDGRVLFKANVAASETYNTRLEHHLVEQLGVRFADRTAADGHLRGAKRAVREIVGIDSQLLTRWSTRRTQITGRQTDLAAQFRRDHGRPPTPVEALHLAQQANLETRAPKHSARALDDQRTTWSAEAVEILGSEKRMQRMLVRALSPTHTVTPQVDDAWIDRTAGIVVRELEQRRATWQTWHVRAEAQRQVRTAGVTDDVVQAVVDRALERHSVSLAGPSDESFGIIEPASLRRADGTSVYTVAGSELYSSERILNAEQRLIDLAGTTGAPAVPAVHLDLAVLEAAANGVPLDASQEAMVREMATSGRSLQLAIAPAGTGKTTAVRALASAWSDAGGDVLALAPSAAAAGQLTDALDGIPDVVGDTLAKVAHTLDHLPERLSQVAEMGASTLVLIDEAGLADTLTLDQITHHATTQGATVRLIGDDQQLTAIGAGGVLRDIQREHGALRLDQLHRFADPDEAAATIALRDGNTDAIEFYLQHDRVHVGDELSILRSVHDAWAADRAAGLDALMLAPTRDQVRDLNATAQAAIGHASDRPTAALADGLTAGDGDLIITRTNDRRLRLSATDWVKNGDRWHVIGVTDDGGLDVTHATSGLSLRLPRDYVERSVELGYATTTHTAQGLTCDTVHGLLEGGETRQELYTLATRGRLENHLYVPAGATTGDPHQLVHPDAIHPETARETLAGIIERDGAARSATTEFAAARDPRLLAQQAADRYTDALAHACEDLLGPVTVKAIEDHCDHRIPGITDAPAWPTLRRDLIVAAANGENPIDLFDLAATRGRLGDARDAAAVISWRLPLLTQAGNTGMGSGDLPLVPAVLRNHRAWGTYLAQRARHAIASAETQRSSKRIEETPRRRPDPAPPRLSPGPSYVNSPGF